MRTKLGRKWALPASMSNVILGAAGSSRRQSILRTAEIWIPIALGILVGTAVILPRFVRPDWLGLMVLATIAGAVVLLVRNVRWLLLILLIVDLPLGLDVMLAKRPDHIGGPSGLFVSLMTIALALGWVYSMTRLRGSDRIKAYFHPAIAVPALFYLAAVAASALQATEVWFTLAQVFLEVQFLLLFFLVANLIRTWADLRVAFTTVAVCLLLEGLLMFFQYYAGFEFHAFGIYTEASASEVASAAARVSGTFSSPNIAATFLSVALATTLAGYLSDGRLVPRWLALSAFLIGLVALVMTQSRGGWIAAALSLSLLLVLALRRRISARAGMFLLSIILVLGIASSTVILERFVIEDRGSAVSRIYHSRLALNIIGDYMLTGVGANNQSYFLVDDRYRPPELIGATPAAIHNTYLAIWAELGIFGLLAFLWLVTAGGWCALSAFVRTRDQYAAIALIGLLAALVAYLVGVLTEPLRPRRMQALWLTLAFIAATSRIAGEIKEPQEPWLQPDPPLPGR